MGGGDEDLGLVDGVVGLTKWVKSPILFSGTIIQNGLHHIRRRISWNKEN